ncbi:DNA mismatch repair protein Msh6 [Mycena floridula]|nr:DNA mismatch repair protein Msh6 [Mycena floridula]
MGRKRSCLSSLKAKLPRPRPLKPKAPLKKSTTTASASKPFVTPRKMEPEGSMSSSPFSGGTSSKDTPPTSDFIDIDMLSDDDQPIQVKSVNAKRKMIIADSDEETMAASAASSSPTETRGRLKKARLSAAPSDDDDEEEIQAEAASSFSKRLTHFKRVSPKKSRSKASSDDDDFIAPSDSDIEIKSMKSSSSRAPSRSSLISDDDLDEDEVPVAKKPKAKGKPVKSKVATTGATPSGEAFSFLTAAERREQDKKDKKKEAESPYGFLTDIRDKDRRRPSDPNYDPRTLYIPPSAWGEFTPFEKQFWEIKQHHYDTVLFFQKGKFFELYEDDARIGHQQFDLKLTQRVKMCMVGVPEMSFNFWAAKFLGKGHKVGRVDQAETALGAEMRLANDKGKEKAKEKEKIVRRALHKVYTNGTLVDAEMLTDDEAGHCISIREQESVDGTKNTFGVCVLDCSTSQFNLSVFEDDVCRTKLETLLRQVRPKELVFTKGQLSVDTTRLLKVVLPAACIWTSLRTVEGFDYDATLVELKKLYPGDEEMDEEMLLPSSVPEAIRSMADSKNALEALGAMIWYLRQLNIDKDILSMKNFNIYNPMKKDEALLLDGQSLAHLELLLNNEGTEEGTLLKLLGRCITPSGKRLFRGWLCRPLKEIDDINARLDAVEGLIGHLTFQSEFTEVAKGLPDLERIVSRIHAKSCKVKEFLKAFKKLSRGLTKLANSSESFESKTVLGLLRGAPDLLANIQNVESLYETPETDASELIPQDGKDDDYDEINTTIANLEEELDVALAKFQKKLSFTMKWWHSGTGTKDIYLIETNASEKNVPKDWTKHGSTKAKTRWAVGSLQPTIRSLKEAKETRNTVIKAFRLRVYEEFDADRPVWIRAIRILAELDCLLSLAKSSLALGEPSCRPIFVEGDSASFDFKSLRHPTLYHERQCEGVYTERRPYSNMYQLYSRLVLGPNMAGKSTLMRMTATGIIMAQLGMFVPAEEARICPVDAILTRMGAYDQLFANASTFKVELDECCKILRDATPKSLVVLDELGRGTSTYDGMAIAGAVLHELATRTLPLSFFATHYGSLTDDFAYHPSILNMHMSSIVDEEKRDIVFLFKLVEGVATSSFGTHVANLAGIPLEVVERADLISKKFAEQFKERLAAKQKTAKLSIEAQADFVYLFKLATGQVSLPTDPARQRVLLKLLKETARRHISV